MTGIKSQTAEEYLKKHRFCNGITFTQRKGQSRKNERNIYSVEMKYIKKALSLKEQEVRNEGYYEAVKQAKQEGKQELWDDLRDMKRSGCSPISPDIETHLWRDETIWLKKRHNLK